jgi:hypothetical protein
VAFLLQDRYPQNTAVFRVPRTLARASAGIFRQLVRAFCAIFRAGCGLGACANRRGVGPPRKPLPRKTIPADLRSLARGHTELCIKVLAGIVSQQAVPPAARVSAAGILLDRGWGKPQQDGNVPGEIRVTIRKMLGDDED